MQVKVIEERRLNRHLLTLGRRDQRRSGSGRGKISWLSVAERDFTFGICVEVRPSNPQKIPNCTLSQIVTHIGCCTASSSSSSTVAAAAAAAVTGTVRSVCCVWPVRLDTKPRCITYSIHSLLQNHKNQQPVHPPPTPPPPLPPSTALNFTFTRCRRYWSDTVSYYRTQIFGQSHYYCTPRKVVASHRINGTVCGSFGAQHKECETKLQLQLKSRFSGGPGESEELMLLLL